MKLKKINLSLGKESKHSKIKTDGTNYLIKYNGEFFAGPFQEEWYGLFFPNWNAVGLQFDTPGTNSSQWENVWEIIE